MTRAFAVVCALTPVIALSACTLLVSTAELAGPAEVVDASDAAAPSSDAAGDGESAPLGASCRAIHERFPDAGSGVYTLTGDGGAGVRAHCDMESSGGGWTLVTSAMIVEEKSVQDYAPDSPGRVEVAHATDSNGGITLRVRVTVVNCGTATMKTGPGHYFLVGELDGWKQIMATYDFANSVSCWNIFGDPGLHDTNVQTFDPAVDLIGPQVNMSRTAAGNAIPFDGRTTACTEKPDNFWVAAYSSERKSARVALRRFTAGLPAGIALRVDCGMPTWTISDIRVR
jgi:hypothetical protein